MCMDPAKTADNRPGRWRNGHFRPRTRGRTAVLDAAICCSGQTVFDVDARQRRFNVLRVLRVVAGRLIAGFSELDQLCAHVGTSQRMIRLRERDDGNEDERRDDERLNRLGEFSPENQGIQR